VGFIVSRAVGPAVTRNRLRRQLRHIVRARLASLPDATALVVRANPSAAHATSAELAAAFDRALQRRRDRMPSPTASASA
jgi:ribonuclease P protein component